MVWVFGLPRTTPMLWGPYSRTRAGSAVAMASYASSQPASRSLPPLRTRGVRSRSGSESSAPKAAPLGQMKPRLKTSSRSPRAPVTAVPSMVRVRPQVASQRGQMRRAVRGMGPPGAANCGTDTGRAAHGARGMRGGTEHTDQYARRGGACGREGAHVVSGRSASGRVSRGRRRGRRASSPGSRPRSRGRPPGRSGRPASSVRRWPRRRRGPPAPGGDRGSGRGGRRAVR